MYQTECAKNKHDPANQLKKVGTVIIKGVKTLDDVPDRLKEAVKAILEGDN